MEDADLYDTQTQRGFLKLELTGTDFGHKDFQPSFTQAVIKNEDPLNLPQEPYTPLIKSLSVNYTSAQRIEFAADAGISAENTIDQFFHIEPYGISEVKDRVDSTPVLPQFTVIDTNDETQDATGHLFLGIANLDLQQSRTLSLLFQVSEGSSNPDASKEDIYWLSLIHI